MPKQSFELGTSRSGSERVLRNSRMTALVLGKRSLLSRVQKWINFARSTDLVTDILEPSTFAKQVVGDHFCADQSRHTWAITIHYQGC